MLTCKVSLAMHRKPPKGVSTYTIMQEFIFVHVQFVIVEQGIELMVTI